MQYLPITVKLIFKFLVGELRKSTRHRYIPSSDSLMLSTFSWAGVLAVLKNARCPNAVGDDVDFACVNGRPRTSKLFACPARQSHEWRERQREKYEHQQRETGNGQTKLKQTNKKQRRSQRYKHLEA